MWDRAVVEPRERTCGSGGSQRVGVTLITNATMEQQQRFEGLEGGRVPSNQGTRRDRTRSGEGGGGGREG